ncbi:MAG: class I SAM-dependent methyltransferase [Limnochordales bacterium]|nr:class I SAM-dependent methyltransferase [Limnochordales bacterium]
MNGKGEHYYSARPQAPSRRLEFTHEFRGRTFHFVTDTAVFSRTRLDRGTELLLLSLPLPLTGRVLDLGCGYGPVGVIVAAFSPVAEVVMIDINERAVALARENVERNGVSGERITLQSGDGTLLLTEAAFDYILTNPPIRAGKKLIHSWIAGARRALLPGGSLYLVARTSQGAKSLFAYMGEVFGRERVEVWERGSGYRVLRAWQG